MTGDDGAILRLHPRTERVDPRDFDDQYPVRRQHVACRSQKLAWLSNVLE